MVQYSVKDYRATDVTLSYVEGPLNGEAILLIHGVGSRWQPFQPIMPGLSEYFHVYAIDLRGHGKSGHTPGAYHLDDYTGDVQEFIANQVETPAVIYGHSLGALVAINLAARQPGSVRKLILGDPPLYYHNTTTRETFWQKAFQDLIDFMLAYPNPELMRASLALNFPNMSSERREERVRSLETLDPDVLRAIITDELMKGISLTALASQVNCPVLLLQGEQRLGSAMREEDLTFVLTHFQDIHVLKMEMIGHGIIPVSQLPDLVEFAG